MKLTKSIQFKLISLLFMILFIAITFAITFTVEKNKTDLLNESQKNLLNNAALVDNVIRSIMLAGMAEIAVTTINNIELMDSFNEFSLYRTDGSSAFNNYETLEFVNSYQDNKFGKTERVNKYLLENPLFIKALETHKPFLNEIKKSEEMEFIYPILNFKNCQDCHGLPEETSSIRGVLHFKISISHIYNRLEQTQSLLTFIFLAIGIILFTLLFLIIRKVILKPVLSIGDTVKQVGNGDFTAKVPIRTNDEIGELGKKINKMTQGLKERFELSKYVSKSTDKFIRNGESNQSNAEKKNLTILFSDIRGFTSFSENHSPDFVIKQLNSLLELQAHIIEQFDGDIDKFVGDEIMAIFKDPLTAVRCAIKMVSEVAKYNKLNQTDQFIGIGINTGEVVTGNIGSEKRLEYAVIGDTVNLAARLCSLAKKSMVIISESSYNIVKEKIEVKKIKNQIIKGKSEGHTIYIVKGVKN